MQTLVERGCGLDVHQATVVACLLIVLKNGQAPKQTRTFGTTTRELLALREWLLSQSCTHVAMESTGVYWKPVYAVLEGGALEIVVANAQHVKKVPGEGCGMDCGLALPRLAAFQFRSAQADSGTARLDALSPQVGGKPGGRTQPPAEITGDRQHQVGQRGQRCVRSLRPVDAASPDRRKSNDSRNGQRDRAPATAAFLGNEHGRKASRATMGTLLFRL